jgi:hypothetical protein
MAWKRLSGEVKTFIVQSLACFDSPSAVAKAVRRRFGRTIIRQTVQRYDPYLRAGAKLSPEWRQLFDDTRKAFLEETGRIGISHRAVRLRRLEAQFELAEERGDSAMVARLLEQAAKETGGAYTNRRELSGRGGKPIELQATPDPAPDDETLARAILVTLAKGEKARERRERGEGDQ